MMHTWILEISILMILSLVIQALLTFLAPLRKSNSNGYLSGFMWFLYLSADSVALFIIGLISRRPQSDSDPRSDILAFWAPFLLLHLGGPDTITALALEDNELWHRHALQLITQTVVTFYVFGLSMVRGRHNRLWLPMVLMFIDGFIKYVERTFALYYASREGIRASLGEERLASYNRLTDKYYSAETSNIPSRFQFVYILGQYENNVGDTDDSDFCQAKSGEIVNYAYILHNRFKGILADDFPSIQDEQIDFEVLFLKQPIHKGIEIILAGLNLFYDLLHTKVFLISKKRGFLRIFCFLSLITASLLFFFATRSNSRYYYVDVGVSFTLLGGAIVLDIVAFPRFLYSDWFIIMLTKLMKIPNPPIRLPKNIISALLDKSIRNRDRRDAKMWCQSTSSYNLLSYSLERKTLQIFLDVIPLKRINDCMINWLYVKQNPLKMSHLEFIFKELQQKAILVRGDREGREQVCHARGNLVLEQDYILVSEYLRPWTIDVEDYSQSMLIWHLATDICYWIESDQCEPGRELSKQLSDYMVYLILRCQDLVPQLVIKSDDHFERAKKEIGEFYNGFEKSGDRMKTFSEYVVYDKLYDRVASTISKINEREPVFDEACCLAKQLVMFGDKKWEIISKVWVEMLCYAAIRSLPRCNFASLSKGGELITLVWVFMSHLGFRLPLTDDRRIRSAKLVICK